MVKRLMSLGAIAALAVTVGFVGTTAAGAAGPKPPKGKTTCSTVTGNIATTITVSGCVDASGANTGGGSHPLSPSVLASGGTITWNSGKTTTVAAPTTKTADGKKCPGYVKGAASNPSQVTFKGTVPGPDSAGFKIPGKYSGVVCVAANGNISALKPLKAS